MVINLWLLHCSIISIIRRTAKNGMTPSRDTAQVYEDPDKLGSRGQGNYELTQCPAYESTTSKPQPTESEYAEL